MATKHNISGGKHKVSGSPIKALQTSVGNLSAQQGSVDMKSLLSLLDARYLRKIIEDTSYNNIYFRNSSVNAKDFKTIGARAGNVTGIGALITTNADGTAKMEIDELAVRRIMFVNELIIAQATHTGGVNLTSAANAIIADFSFVSYDDDSCPIDILDLINYSLGDDEKLDGVWRCRFDNQNNNLTNLYQVGDVALAQTFNYDPSGNYEMKYYRRRVLGIGMNYIDLELGGIALAGVEGSNIANGDNACQWGHLWDRKRQSVVEINTLEGGRQSFFQKMGDCRDVLTDARREVDYEDMTLDEKRSIWGSDLWYNDTDKNVLDMGYLYTNVFGDAEYRNAIIIKGDFAAITKDGKQGFKVNNKTGEVEVACKKFSVQTEFETYDESWFVGTDDKVVVIETKADAAQESASAAQGTADQALVEIDELRDSENQEKIFKLSASNVKPIKPDDAPYTDDYIPDGWTDDFGGVSAEEPYCFRCDRSKSKGVWSDWTEPALFTSFGKDASLADAVLGAVNLLRNSGFTGDYATTNLEASSEVSSSELYSDRLKYWSGNATVVEYDQSISGHAITKGTVSQPLDLITGESYVIGVLAEGTSVSVSCGDYSQTVELSNESKMYEFKFSFSGVGIFTINVSGKAGNIKLERGIVRTDWTPSPLDNDKALAQFQAYNYIQDAIQNNSTDILGGLVLTNILKLGNYLNGKMEQDTAGISGVYNDGDDVSFWSGGTFEQAIRTVMKFRQNPNYQPTDEEWAEMANIVMTHGGDAFFRGYIYALGGIFKNVIVNGSIRSPFQLFQSDASIASNSLTDNAIYFVPTPTKAGDAEYLTSLIPWDSSQIGRTINVVHGRNEDGDLPYGWVLIEAESGKYFFQDGLTQSSINISREIVELQGYGVGDTFFGWIVKSRKNIETTYHYGRPINAMAIGLVNYDDGDLSVTYYAPDERVYLEDDSNTEDFISVERVSTGLYKLHVPDYSYWGDLSNLMLFTQGIYSNKPRYVTINGFTTDIDTGRYYLLRVSDDDSLNDGSFYFAIYSIASLNVDNTSA